MSPCLSFTLFSRVMGRGSLLPPRPHILGWKHDTHGPLSLAEPLNPSAGHSTACFEPLPGGVGGGALLRDAVTGPLSQQGFSASPALGSISSWGLPFNPLACLSLSCAPAREFPRASQEVPSTPCTWKASPHLPLPEQFIEESQIFDFSETNNIPVP